MSTNQLGAVLVTVKHTASFLAHTHLLSRLANLLSPPLFHLFWWSQLLALYFALSCTTTLNVPPAIASLSGIFLTVNEI